MENFRNFLSSAKILLANKRALALALVGLSLSFFSMAVGPFLDAAGQEKIREVNAYAADDEVYVNAISQETYDRTLAYAKGNAAVVSTSEALLCPLEKAVTLGDKEEANAERGGAVGFDDERILRFRVNAHYRTGDFSGFVIPEALASRLVSEEGWDPYVIDENGMSVPNPDKPAALDASLCLGRVVAFTANGVRKTGKVTNIYATFRDSSFITSAMGGNEFSMRSTDQAPVFAPYSVIGRPSGWGGIGDGVLLRYSSPVAREEEKRVAKAAGIYDASQQSHLSGPHVDVDVPLGNWAVVSMTFRTASWCLAFTAVFFSLAVLLLERKRFVRAYHVYWLAGADEAALFGYQAYHASLLLLAAFAVASTAHAILGSVFLVVAGVTRFLSLGVGFLYMLGLLGALLALFALNACLIQRDVLGRFGLSA